MSEQKQAPKMIYVLAASLAAFAGFLAVYGTLAPKSNGLGEKPAAKSAEKPSTAPTSGKTTNKLNKGKMVGFVFKKTPADLPEISFKDETGKDLSIADWRGKIVLLNLWATWCAPCRKEMPDLDNLQKEMGSDDFQVVALSIDRGGMKKPKEFLEKIGVKNLTLYNDSSSKSATKLRALGMPTTLLIGRDGKEIGRLTGPAEWDHEDAVTLIKAAIEGKAS